MFCQSVLCDWWNEWRRDALSLDDVNLKEVAEPLNHWVPFLNLELVQFFAVLKLFRLLFSI